MKKKYIIFLLALCISTVCIGQSTYDFSTPANIFKPSYWDWNTVAPIQIGDVEYKLSSSGNGSFTNVNDKGGNIPPPLN